MKTKKKIYKDRKGRDSIKETYFVGGKMKFRKVYVIDEIPAEEFYEKNATDLDHFLKGDYWLISYEKDYIQVANQIIKSLICRTIKVKICHFKFNK